MAFEIAEVGAILPATKAEFEFEQPHAQFKVLVNALPRQGTVDAAGINTDADRGFAEQELGETLTGALGLQIPQSNLHGAQRLHQRAGRRRLPGRAHERARHRRDEGWDVIHPSSLEIRQVSLFKSELSFRRRPRREVDPAFAPTNYPVPVAQRHEQCGSFIHRTE